MMKNMAYSNKVFVFVFVMFFSSYIVQFGMCESETSIDQLLEEGLEQQSTLLHDAKCMKRLIPCHEFLKSSNDPSPHCCDPLKQIHENDTQCLCHFLKSPLVQSINVSKDDIFKLPKACGINIDISECKNTAGTTQQGEDEEKSSSTMITPYGIIYGFVAVLTAIVFSSY